MSKRVAAVMMLNEIHINKQFQRTPPRQEKLDKVRDFYEKHGKLDKPIKVNAQHYLIDGYTRYLIAKEIGLDFVDVVIYDNSNELDDIPKTEKEIFAEQNKDRLSAGENEYIVGIFPNNENRKEYVWINRKGIIVNVGDTVRVKCKRADGRIFTAPALCVRKFWSADEPEHRSITNVLKRAS